MATKKTTTKQASTRGRKTPSTVNSGVTKSRRYCSGGKLKK